MYYAKLFKTVSNYLYDIHNFNDNNNDNKDKKIIVIIKMIIMIRIIICLDWRKG